MTLTTKSSSQSMKKMHFHSQTTYYSKTQANFFKAYAHQIQFVNRLNDLMSAIEKRKVVKATEQVKTCNKAFRKYLNERRIVHIKIDDVIAFQELYQKMNLTSQTNNFASSSSNLQELKRTLLPSISFPSTKKQSRVSHLNLSSKMFINHQSKQQNLSANERQMIKKGFMTLLQKLETLKKDEFTNQTKYLESVLMRESQKLKEYGIGQSEDQDDWKRKNRKYNAKQMSIVEEIEKEEKMNGLYPIIMKNIREETFAIQKAEKTYETLMKD